MRGLLLLAAAACALTACNMPAGGTDQAGVRQTRATMTAMDQADREVGMPRIVNYAQKKLLKNAYEDMDQTTLTYVYTQGIDGRLVCLGQALGYGVSMGTQFTPPEYPRYLRFGADNPAADGTYTLALPEPNGLYMPASGDATIVDMIDPATGQAHTAMIEPKVMTVPYRLKTGVSQDCPTDVDKSKIVDAKETSVVEQAK